MRSASQFVRDVLTLFYIYGLGTPLNILDMEKCVEYLLKQEVYSKVGEFEMFEMFEKFEGTECQRFGVCYKIIKGQIVCPIGGMK